jgi:transcriptional regulator with XRE-family HTH domain
MHKAHAPRYNVSLLSDDMALRGWMAVDLARRAGVSHMTVHRFLTGERQTPRTAKKLAEALNRRVSRYLIPAEQVA